MAIFYTDSSSFNNLTVIGSTIMSASDSSTIPLQIIGTGSTVLSVSGSSGEILNISDTPSNNNLFSVSSGSIEIFSIKSTKETTVSGSLYIKDLPLGITANVLLYDSQDGKLYYTSSNKLTEIGPISATGSTLYSVTPKSTIPDPSTANNSIFLGSEAGVSATNAATSNFIGYQAGYSASGALIANFIGRFAGYSASSAYGSNFLGNNAGYRATGANNSNFIGTQAGFNASNAYYSNFIGALVGQNASDAYYSNFMGYYAGYSASNAYYSNFIGNNSGYLANNAYYSNFIGYGAGGVPIAYTVNSSYSNFIGYQAGYRAINASNSNFIGKDAGLYSEDASYSVFIGYQAGRNNSIGFTNGPGSNNIIIGTNITFPVGRKDSINIGGIIFGTGSYSNIITPSTTAANGKIGINSPLPLYELDVSGSTRISNVLILPFQSPLPSNSPTASIALSGSGGTFEGMYVYNGTSWINVKT